MLDLSGIAPGLAGLRAEVDPARAARLPFHLTLLFPFAPVAQLDLGRLRSFFAGRPPLVFSLAGIALLDGEWVYAALDPIVAVEGLQEALWAHYPEYPPYDDEIPDPVPHATLTRVERAAAAEELARISELAAPLLPEPCTVEAVSLLEERDGDRWPVLERLPLEASA